MELQKPETFEPIDVPKLIDRLTGLEQWAEDNYKKYHAKKCETCDDEKKVTNNEGQDNEFDEDCPECVGKDDSDFTGVTEDR